MLVLKSCCPDQVLAVDAVPVPVEASARSNFVLPAAADFCRMELPEDPASTSIPSFRFAVTPLPVTVLLLDPVVSVVKWIPSCVLPTVLVLEIRFQPESISSDAALAPLLMVELLEPVYPVVALVPADWSRMPFRALWLAPLLTTVLLLAVVKPAMEPAMTAMPSSVLLLASLLVMESYCCHRRARFPRTRPYRHCCPRNCSKPCSNCP